jgi:hypothetical protein
MANDDRMALFDLVYQMPLWALALGLSWIPLAIAPWVTTSLDARGLPGFGVAFALILLGPAVAAFSYLRKRGSLRRARERKRDAERLGLHFARRFTIPRSMSELPSLAGLEVLTSARGWGAAVGVADLVSGRLTNDEIVAFDFWANGDTPYAPVAWRSLVAVSTGIEAQPVIIEPRHIATFGKAWGVEEMPTESVGFDRRYRVWGFDRRFTSALLDQRMIAWMLQAESDWAFQAGGRWVAVVGPLFQGADLDHAIDLTRAFRSHIPRVVSSLYPQPDPGFASAN